MTFNSLAFAAFFPVVLAGYYVLDRRAQNVWLVLASYVFYGWWDWRFLALLIVATLVDYVCGLRMGQATSERPRRFYLRVSLASQLGILGLFKYCDFFVDSAATLLSGIGLPVSLPLLRIVVPVGVSFYTFQTL